MTADAGLILVILSWGSYVPGPTECETESVLRTPIVNDFAPFAKLGRSPYDSALC